MNDAWHRLSAGPKPDSAGYHRHVRPRDAATLIVVRFDADAPRVLMGRRSSAHRFMPNMVVFPGGRVDRADLALAPIGVLDPVTRALLLAGLGQNDGERRARALALAAIRETFEETGALIGRTFTGAKPRTRAAAWSEFLAHGVLPGVESLQFLARAITPPGLVRRFDTRFFLTDARAIASNVPPPTAELIAPTWQSFAEARASDLPAITRAVLDLAEERLPDLVSGRFTASAPFFRVKHGRRIIDWTEPAP